MPVTVRTLREAQEYVRLNIVDFPDAEFVFGTGYRDSENRRVSVYKSWRRPGDEPKDWEFFVLDPEVTGYGPGTSSVIDGGQWLMLFGGYTQQLRAWHEQMFGPELRPIEEGEQFQRTLGFAEDCLTELRKLLVEHGSPEATVWTDQGRAMLSTEAKAFDLEWIDAQVAYLKSGGDRLVQRYRDAERRGLI